MKIANIGRGKLLNELRKFSEIFRKDVTEGVCVWRGGGRRVKLIPPSNYPLMNVTNGAYGRLTLNIFSLTCDITIKSEGYLASYQTSMMRFLAKFQQILANWF